MILIAYSRIVRFHFNDILQLIDCLATKLDELDKININGYKFI